MKTIIVANQKGGVGKTTIARHLAFMGIQRRLRVLAVDLDIQANFSVTFKKLEETSGHAAKRAAANDTSEGLTASGLFDVNDQRVPFMCDDHMHYIPADPGAIVGVERGDLQQVISAGQTRFAELGKDFDLCVVDTGPSVSNLLLVALSVGDFAVSPCKMDRDSIAGAAAFFSNVLRVRDETGINPDLAPLGVLPNLVEKDRAYHRAALEEIRAAWGDVVLPIELYARAAIDVAKDRAVWSTLRGDGRSAAALEMKAVCSYIFNRIGLGEQA
jgi:chromosome partitioning protein